MPEHTLTLCDSCKRTIFYSAGTKRWVHSDTRNTWCGDGQTFAAPLSMKPAAQASDKHTMRWYGVIPAAPSLGQPVELVPRTRFMNGRDWGWDVKCSCGWESRTGGGIEADVRRKIADHRWDVAHEGDAS